MHTVTEVDVIYRPCWKQYIYIYIYCSMVVSDNEFQDEGDQQIQTYKHECMDNNARSTMASIGETNKKDQLAIFH